MTISMGKGLKHGLMAVDTRVAISKERKTDRANIFGKMAAITVVIGKTIK